MPIEKWGFKVEQTKVSAEAIVRSKCLMRMNIIAACLFSLAVLVCASGCASFERSSRSGYFQRDSDSRLSSVEDERRDYRRQQAEDELGPTSSDRAVAYREMLKRQESLLEGKSEREQYYKAKPYLRGDAERIRFLSLGSTTERDRYLNAKGINGDQISHPPAVQTLIDENDIAVGMTRQAVKESWGPADNIDVAGNPMYGNEKWYYTGQITSSEGYMTERRTVVFESGLVVGWETN